MRCVGQQPTLGRTCLSKSRPRPHSLWSLHLFVFPSEAATLRCVPPWAVASWSGDHSYCRLGVCPFFPNVPTMLWCPWMWCGQAGVMVGGSWAAFLGSAADRRGKLGNTLCLFVVIK